jgi:2,3-bisphosphoglycerate-dependent phosphoglycerate mutase
MLNGKLQIVNMARIFIFRHGQTTDNLAHDFSGIRDVDLTPAGIEEAKQIGEKLKNEPVTKAYQSNQIRSKHTLELVLNGFHKNVEIITDPRIRERDYGNLTGKNKDELKKIDPKNFALWHRSYDIPPPNGESIKDVEARVLQFINDEKPKWNANDVIFISAHGNSIRPMRRYFENLTIEQMCNYEYTPGQIFSYEI